MHDVGLRWDRVGWWSPGSDAREDDRRSTASLSGGTEILLVQSVVVDGFELLRHVGPGVVVLILIEDRHLLGEYCERSVQAQDA
uniref:Uncharacterized protein n=1 Tax=uncultured bacterium A1Q1_fos_1000 TaxID=1256536 RepID=L7VVB5_9BACT|nr:hypothetical protein [uncultured bacterium A1Q1_fos_1000]